MLAGAVLFTGRSRTLLAGVFLPPAMLLTTIWRNQVLGWQFAGYDLNVLALLAMTLLAHLAIGHSLLRRQSSLAITAAVLAGGGLVVTAASAGAREYPIQMMLEWAGLAASSAAAILLVVSVFRPVTAKT